MHMDGRIVHMRVIDWRATGRVCLAQWVECPPYCRIGCGGFGRSRVRIPPRANASGDTFDGRTRETGTPRVTAALVIHHDTDVPQENDMPPTIAINGRIEIDGSTCPRCESPVHFEDVTIVDDTITATLVCTACGHTERITVS